MARCAGASCACKFSATGNDHINITGSGTPADPFVIHADISVKVNDATDLNLTIGGTGTSADPWIISGALGASSKLNHLGDVSKAAPTNAQVLGWDAASGTWSPRNPTTAAAGSVTKGNGLSGDGSAGAPLDLRLAASSGLEVVAAGTQLTAGTKAAIVQKFTNAAGRTTELPSPLLNQLTTIDTKPGLPEWWDGAAWQPLMQVDEHKNVGGAFLALSGAYDGRPVTLITKQLTVTTDVSGSFDVLTAADLSAYVGVLAVVVQPTGAIAWTSQVVSSTSKVTAVAYRTDGTGVYAGQTLTGIAFAVAY